MDTDEIFQTAVREELKEARRKFPNPDWLFAALVEEVGELAKALLDHRLGEVLFEDVVEEAIQVAAMAQRIAVEGDPSFHQSRHLRIR